MEEIKEKYELDTPIMCGPGTCYFRNFLEDYIQKKWIGISARWFFTQMMSNTIVWRYFKINGSVDYRNEAEKEDFSQLAIELLEFMKN